MKRIKLEELQEKPIWGTVKFFNQDKGFGFISTKEVGDLHLSAAVLMNFDSNLSLSSGDKLLVSTEKSNKGFSVKKIYEINQAQKYHKKEKLADKIKIEKYVPSKQGITNINFYSFIHKTNTFFQKDERNFKGALKRKKYDRIDFNEQEFPNDKGQKKLQSIENFEWQNEAFFTKHLENQRAAAQALTNGQLKADSHLAFSPDWRMIVGLGSGSVYETSITLHHIHGFPYIPASAVKGMLRSWLITTVFTQNVPDEETEYPLVNAEFRAYTDSESFCRIFGCPSEIKKVKFEDQKPVKKENGDYKYCNPTQVKLRKKDKPEEGQEHIGDILFFDAYPTAPPKLKVDIMNPHYGPYYSNNEGTVPPADYHNPVPIPFLTVDGEKGCSFQFVLGLRRGVKDFKVSFGENPKYEGNALDTLPLFFRCALTQHGIGAKTAVGYGYMNPVA